MPEQIAAANYWRAYRDHALLDVRSPGEYLQGHLPGAHSLPLFDDDERAEVGTLYKQESPDAALLRGLEFAGAKMRHYVEQARAYSEGRPVVVHCWRGGQRSQSMAWLLERAGMSVRVLYGGYKDFRGWQRRWLAEVHHSFIVLGGPTGAGKTRLLSALKQRGESVIDLEGLANHRGSSFGGLGQTEAQPTSEQFENNLFAHLSDIEAGRRIWLEDESRMIGTVYIPDPFWDRMQASPLLELQVSKALRLRQLVEEYGRFPTGQLREAFERISKRLGGQHLKAAVAALEANELSRAAEIALRYYDKAYERSGAGREAKHFSVGDEESWEAVAERISALRLT